MDRHVAHEERQRSNSPAEREVNGKRGTHLHASVWTAGASSLRGLVASRGGSGLVRVLLLRLLLLSLGDGLRVLLVLVHGPVKDIVILEALADEEVAENLAKVRVVRLIIEAERARVVEVDGKFVGEAPAKDFGRRRHLLLHDAVVFLLLGGSLETLPGKRAAAEVEHDIAERLHVVSARLLNAEVGVDAGIASGTGQVLVLAVRNVKVRFRVAIFFGQTKVDDVDLIAALADAHEKVVRLNVTVDEGLGVDVLDAGDELVGEKQDGLQGELAVAKVEQIFQAGSKQVQDHGVVVALGAEPANEGDPHAASQRLVHASLIFELRVLGLDALELDGNLFAGDDVGAYAKREQAVKIIGRVAIIPR